MRTLCLRPAAAIAAALFALVAVDARCLAQEQEGSAEESEARMHFRVGRAYYESGRFTEAAREFERAYELSRRPELLHNMFVAHRDAGNLAAAIRALREYLRLNPDAAEREQLTARLAAMERLAAQQGISSDAAGDASTADEAPSGATADSSGASQSSAQGGGGMWTPGWIVAGVGAAAVIGGIITGALALGEQSALSSMCDATRTCDPGFEGTRDSAGLLAGLTDGLLFGGGTVAVLGIVLALIVPSGESSSASLWCTGSGCFGSTRIRF